MMDWRFLIIGFVVLLGTASPASSETSFDVSEDGDSWTLRQPANATAIGGSLLARKRYPGGADEDDLQVQPTLPNPSRGLEAHEAAISTPSESSTPTSD